MQADLQNNQNQIEEEEKIFDLITDINKHIRTVENFLTNINDDPESSSLITWSIIFSLLLFWIGVIIPLSFLPIVNVVKWEVMINSLFSIKGLLIICILLIFSIIMIIFFTINLRLKYNEEKIDILVSDTKIKNYSPYFKNMVENKKYLNGS
ncbi:MAG: hypothetical protein ACOCRO_09220, partial [Halanaerobiales bacterium]